MAFLFDLAGWDCENYHSHQHHGASATAHGRAFGDDDVGADSYRGACVALPLDEPCADRGTVAGSRLPNNRIHLERVVLFCEACDTSIKIVPLSQTT